MAVLKLTPVKALPFSKQLGFRRVLNQRVEQYFKDNRLRTRDVPQMYVKSIVVALWYLATFLLIILGGLPWYVNFGLYVMYAFSIAGIGFNIMHDANHGGYSSNPKVNKVLSLTMELLGSSSMQWRHKHNVLHHTYTNVAGMDEDLETQGLLRLSPHDEWKPMFRWQHVYMPFVYMLTGFGFINRDFRVYFTGRSSEWHEYPKMSRTDKVVFWLGKLVFLMMNLLIPLLFIPWWQAVAGFFITTFTVGLILAAIFQLAHVMDVAAFPEPTGEPLKIENEWAIHEVETTVNYSPANKLLNWYAGGLNFQIEHHLFPQMSHIHYPRVAHIVQQTCTEFGIKYQVCTTYWQALNSHINALRELGRPPMMSGMGAVAK